MQRRPNRKAFRYRNIAVEGGGRDGFVLVLVLCVLVLMLTVTLAFFSRAQLNRSTSASSAASSQSELLAKTAIEMIKADFLHELAAGSVADTFTPSADAAARKIYAPRTVDTSHSLIGAVSGSSVAISTAPSMLPQRVVSTGSAPVTLIKQSLSGRAFFTETVETLNGAGMPAIPNRATPASTSAASHEGRRIIPERWNAPKFAASGEAIPPPDWICLNRMGTSGTNPSTFSSKWADKSRGNQEYVLGRFAYNVYDVGGLIDINVVGNLLDADENTRRGRLHQVSLKDAPGALASPAFATFVTWRSSGDTDDSTQSGALFDPKRNFATVPAQSQAFVTRQDLLRYASRTNSPIPSAALPFLTTFSREMNAPSYAPEPNRPMLPTSPPPAEMNPALTAVRFSQETTLTRGSDTDLTVVAGTPVMVRRFPLAKLNLLAEVSPEAETLAYYFGLQKQSDGSFRYVAASDDFRIKRLSEVAAEGREPNFFEVLQASILTGSLGRDAGNVYTISEPYDANRYYQLMQIGANVIDQWDADDYPTVIAYPMGIAGEFFNSYGTENLPYFNNAAFIPYRPQGDPDRFQLWALFDVWNPHGNANTLPTGIDSFRVLPAGKAKANLRYIALSQTVTSGTDAAIYTTFNNATDFAGAMQDIGTLNSGREMVFPNSDYSSPTVIGGGGAPDAAGVGTWANYTGGLLINDYPSVPMAVPETPPAAPDGRRQFMLLAMTKYSKPKWGAKAHNWFRFGTGALEEDKISFDLQYRVTSASPWITYQKVRGVLPQTTDPSSGSDFAGLQAFAEVVSHTRSFDEAELERVTYQSAADPAICFYGWRNGTVRPYSVNLSKIDPRTARFGFNGNSTDPLGHTVCETIDAYNGSVSNTQFNWRLWFSYFVIGQETSLGVFGDKGFEWYLAPSTRQALPFALIKNIPEGSVDKLVNPGRYRDLDGIIRPADGYLGAKPTANPATASGTGSRDDRPIILNRAFRNVGEMGYVFRDLPWKTIDFFTKNSGDLGLLDAFSLEEAEGDLPLVTGKVNLNSAPKEVIATLLSGAAKTEAAIPVTTSTNEAVAIASAVVQERANGLFRSRGDLVARVLTPETSGSMGVLTDLRKTEREAAIRALSDIGQTRTWNFLIDLVVQTGRFGTAASDPKDFSIRSERRYWVHLALDRFTGEVLEEKWERVDE